MKKVYVQLVYTKDETYWSLVNGKKHYGGKVLPNKYQNYLCEKLTIKCGYEPVHGTLEEIGRVTDLNHDIRYVTYTLRIK